VRRTPNLDERGRLFIGRASELATLGAAVRSHRLVTVTGPAGVGKTALAKRCADAAHRAHRGGAWLCDLTEAATIEDLCRCVARVLDVPLSRARAAADALAQLGAAIARRGRVLLVLDNVEQMIPDAAATVSSWLEATREARFLVTSRERLRVRDEVVMDLAPLRLPPESEDAVELFVERVRANGAQAALAPADGQVIAEIVRQLDGLPLAIELGAARVGVLSPAQLLAQLTRRFDVLTRAARDQSGRQRTLRGAIAWSWELLAPWERSALAQCSVFRGGFSLDAAQAVVSLEGFGGAPEILDVLSALYEKSLLRIERRGAEVRYALYLSVREFAEEAIAADEAVAAAARHAAYFAGAAVEWSELLSQAAGGAAMHRFQLEVDNVLAVVARGVERADHDPLAATAALQALCALDPLFAARGPMSAYASLLDQALGARGILAAPRSLVADAFAARGRNACGQGRLDDADKNLAQAIDLARDDPKQRVRVRVLRTNLLRVQGRMAEARAEVERGFGEAIEADVLSRTRLLNQLGNVERDAGRLPEARRAFEQAASLLPLLGDLRLSAMVSGNLGLLMGEARETEGAKAQLERAMAMAAELGDRRLEALTTGNLACLLNEQGQHAEAASALARAIESLQQIGDTTGASTLSVDHGISLHEQGKLAEAHAVLGAAVEAARPGGLLRVETLARAHLAAIDAERGHADRASAAFDEAEGIMRSIDDRVGLAASGALRAVLDVASGRLDVADKHIALAEPHAATSLNVRSALRLAVRARDRAGPALRVGPGGGWFEAPGAKRADLTDRDALRLILLCLVEAHGSRPGERVGATDLLTAGWPGERVLRSAAASRVRGAVFTLRELGLRTALVGDRRGWMLDPRLRVERPA
jgi:predicted ATPase